jgi:hypothetical protein
VRYTATGTEPANKTRRQSILIAHTQRVERNVPSLDSAPAVVHSGAGAGALGAARSTRTHATLEGAGGAWFGVMTWPIATYPGGGFGRQTATVPVEKKHGVILIAHTRINKITHRFVDSF